MYEVIWCKGDYPARQQVANDAGCKAYVCHHFNALANDNPDTQQDNASLVIVGSNASQRSKDWAADYVDRVCAEFGTRSAGVLQRKLGERGDVCVRYTDMPAILVEPLFVSDPVQARIASTPDGQRRLAECLVDSIRASFPDDDGGVVRIGFSVGHKYKTSKPWDRGAAVVNSDHTEAELAEKVLQQAASLLSQDEDTNPQIEAPKDVDIAQAVIRNVLDEKLEPLLGLITRQTEAVNNAVNLLVEDKARMNALQVQVAENRRDIDRLLDEHDMGTRQHS